MAGHFCHKAPGWPRLKRPDVKRYKQPSCEILQCIMRKGGELTNSILKLVLSVKPFIVWHSSAVSHTQGRRGRRPDILGQLLLTISFRKLPSKKAKCSKSSCLLPSEVTLLPSKQFINRPLINLLSTKIVPFSTAGRNAAILVPQMSYTAVAHLWAWLRVTPS